MNCPHQTELFARPPAPSGEQRKRRGIKKVATNNRDWLVKIRAVAVRICKRCGSVSSDDLRRWADKNDCQPKHPNAWGAVFRGKQWVSVAFKKSETPSRHASLQRVWELRSEVEE